MQQVSLVYSQIGPELREGCGSLHIKMISNYCSE